MKAVLTQIRRFLFYDENRVANHSSIYLFHINYFRYYNSIKFFLWWFFHYYTLLWKYKLKYYEIKIIKIENKIKKQKRF